MCIKNVLMFFVAIFPTIIRAENSENVQPGLEGLIFPTVVLLIIYLIFKKKPTIENIGKYDKTIKFYDETIKFKGQNGKINVFHDRVVISKATFGGFISQSGFSGDRIFFYKDISSIDYKKPSFWANGYIQIIITGTNAVNPKVGIIGSSFESMKDPNTIVLRLPFFFPSETAKKIDKVFSTIMFNFNEAKKSTQNIDEYNSSKIHNLKILAELKNSGVLTEEEFNKEKEILLNSQL